MRFADSTAPSRRPRHLEASAEHLRLVRRHHRIFYAIVLAGPVEWLVRGRPASAWQALAAVIFLAGVIGYRQAGGALGEQLSPLIAPVEPAALVERGPYRHLRHPMYLAQLAMAVGAPLMLAAAATSALAVVLAVVLLRRMNLEEQLLAERLPDYRLYAKRTYRLLPPIY